MERTLPLEEHSIKDIYLESQETITYKIPIYQRNYAWEEDEIKALIKDVYDSMHKNPAAPYYIGTLVTYKRGDNEYEVIDGQQRLTTIYIILKALGIRNVKNRLTYSARKVSASTIQQLDNYPNLGEEFDCGIKNGYKNAKNGIESIVDSSERKQFEQYFLNRVHLIHYKVPKDVDLNHYFEVMNSRGEQLEKHEIVKSLLSQKLKSKAEMKTFSRIWEACSEMNVYIQQVFKSTVVFGNRLDEFSIDSFEEIPQQDEADGKIRIIDLLQQPTHKEQDKSETEQADKFQPIIDFPNFLLIVLKVTITEEKSFNLIEFTLDDKELLNEFRDVINGVANKAKFARKFAFNLLKARYFLDNYVVHHVLGDKENIGDNPWKLQYFLKESNKNRNPKTLSSNQDVQKELVHLLSMFEVTFSPKQRKNYLFYCIKYLFDNYDEMDRECRCYLEFLQSLAHKYFYDVYLNREFLNDRNQPMPNAFDSVMFAEGELDVEVSEKDDVDLSAIFEEIYKQGCADIPLFVFNYTDYILWKKYAEELRGNKSNKGSRERVRFFKELGCSDFELEAFKNFYFSRTRKSLEHFYPQAKAGNDKVLNDSDINCFGNFSMIGAETNSSGSDLDPKTKIDRYCDGKYDQVSVSSLKFKIMMQKCQDNYKDMINEKLERESGLEWNAEDMQEHQQKMLSILDEGFGLFKDGK